MSSPRTRPSQSAMPATNTMTAGNQSQRVCPTRAPSVPRGIGSTTVRAHRPSSATMNCSSSSGSADLEAAALPEQQPHLADQLGEPRLLPRLARARLWEVDVDDADDPAGPRRHHDDAGREEDGLGDRVRDEDDRAAALLPDPQQLEVQALARHLVQRAERLVHQQQRRAEGERTRDRDPLLHPARELPRMVLLEALELDEVDQLLDAVVPLPAVPAEDLERQPDVLLHGAPVEEHRVLEDDPVVAVEPRLVRALAVHDHVAGARLDQVADDPEERRLAAARRADQRDELARPDLELDVLERPDLSLAELLGDRC